MPRLPWLGVYPYVAVANVFGAAIRLHLHPCPKRRLDAVIRGRSRISQLLPDGSERGPQATGVSVATEILWLPGLTSLLRIIAAFRVLGRFFERHIDDNR